MKIFINILLVVCTYLFIISCEDDKAPTPLASITIDKLQLDINESMVIRFNGVADQAVVYTGDDMHKYELRDQSNTGFVVNKDLFTYAYTVPGTYKVVCVASSYTDRATDLKRDTCSYTVTVIDDETEIQKLSCAQVLYDEIFAEKLGNDEWLMLLPHKVKYNTATPSITLSQKLSIVINSDSTKTFINDKEFSNKATTKYDLSKPLDIVVKSHFGTVRPYKLYTLYYPEFNTFKLLGTNGTLVRTEFDYSSFEMQITLPVGTDISNLIPEFTTLSATDKVYIGDAEQTSGSTPVDFTQEVTYRLVSTLPENPAMQSEATVVVKIKYQ